MGKQLIDQLELANDAFYVKLLHEGKPCKYAYLHLDALPSNTFLAFFENSESQKPTYFMWEEMEKGDKYNESKHVIAEFIGEVYNSLYMRLDGKPADKTLWRSPQCINCAIPSRWYDTVSDKLSEIRRNKTNNQDNETL